MSALVTVEGINMASEAPDRADLGKRALDALDNGLGNRLSRIFIIFILPMVSALAGWALHLTLENISLQQQYANQRLDEVLAITRTNESRINTLETNVGKLQEHEASTDQRLSRLEGRK